MTVDRRTREFNGTSGAFAGHRGGTGRLRSRHRTPARLSSHRIVTLQVRTVTLTSRRPFTDQCAIRSGFRDGSRSDRCGATSGGRRRLGRAGTATVGSMETPRHVVVVLLDSLNRHMLGSYGGTEFATPNLDRFAARSTQFTNHVTGSLPCMPARHDILVGALDFLWKPWGSIELWEESITATLRRADVTTMLVSDHPHLFETGGENYHSDFSAWDYLRGHEGDPWRTCPDPSAFGAPTITNAADGGWFLAINSASPTGRSVGATTTTAAPGSAPRRTSPGRARWRRRRRGCGISHRHTIDGCCSSTSSTRTNRSTPPSRGRRCTTTRRCRRRSSPPADSCGRRTSSAARPPARSPTLRPARSATTTAPSCR